MMTCMSISPTPTRFFLNLIKVSKRRQEVSWNSKDDDDKFKSVTLFKRRSENSIQSLQVRSNFLCLSCCSGDQNWFAGLFFCRFAGCIFCPTVVASRLICFKTSHWSDVSGSNLISTSSQVWQNQFGFILCALQNIDKIVLKPPEVLTLNTKWEQIICTFKWPVWKFSEELVWKLICLNPPFPRLRPEKLQNFHLEKSMEIVGISNCGWQKNENPHLKRIVFVLATPPLSGSQQLLLPELEPLF